MKKSSRDISIKIDFWDELSEKQQKSIKRAQLELLLRMGKSHAEVMKKYSAYLSK